MIWTFKKPLWMAISMLIPIISLAQSTVPSDIKEVINTPAAKQALRALLNGETIANQALLGNKVRKSIQLTDEWKTKDGSVTLDETGAIVLVHNESEHTIVCMPLRLCTISLEEGERITDITETDNVRWQVKPIVTGQGNRLLSHVEVKPQRGALTAALSIQTDRRYYQFKLVSHETRYFPRVRFRYLDNYHANNGTDIVPQGVQTSTKETTANGSIQADIRSGGMGMYKEQFAALAYSPNRDMTDQAYSVPLEQAEDHIYQIKTQALNFEYSITGDIEARPIRVYDDGTKTFIEFSKEITKGIKPLPDLYIKYQGEEEIIHVDAPLGYRYDVPFLIDEVVLISGIGWKAKKAYVRPKNSNYKNLKQYGAIDQGIGK